MRVSYVAVLLMCGCNFVRDARDVQPNPHLDFDGRGRRVAVETTQTSSAQDCALYQIEALPQLVGDAVRSSLRAANFIVEPTSTNENITLRLTDVRVGCPGEWGGSGMNRVEISYAAVLSSSENPRLASAHGRQERLRKIWGPGDLDKAFGEVIALAVEDLSGRLLDRPVLGAL